MKKRTGIIAALVVIVLVGLAGGYAYSQSNSHNKAEKSSQRVNLPASATTNNPNLILVNKKHPMQHELNFKKAESNGISYNQKIQKPLQNFLTAADKAGYPATLVSGYRSKKYQEQVFEQNYQENLGKGMSPAAAKKATKGVIQTPGSSEHETGLAVDVMTNEYWNKHHDLQSKSDKTAGQQWLIKHAPDYGFVLRYVKSKAGQKSTGIDYESWHFRYVGVDNSKYMTKHHLTLEQYDRLIKEQGRK